MQGTATEITICGEIVRLGDEIEVRYRSGGSTRGTVIELWESPLQARLSSHWCFHDYDEIISHVRNPEPIPSSD